MSTVVNAHPLQRMLRLKMLRLLENPFEDFADGRYFIPTPQIARIYQEVRQRWFSRGAGLVLIDGEAGSGKSALARFLAGGHLPVPLAIATAPRTANRMLKLINDGLGLPRVKEEESRRQRLMAFLENQYAAIVIDQDPHKMTPPQGQLIAALARRTTVVVTGYEVFNYPWENWGVSNVARYLLNPWDYDTLVFVLDEISRRAGRSATPLFTPEAMERVYMLSEGNPRRTLALCRNAVESLLQSEGATVEAWMIEEVQSE